MTEGNRSTAGFRSRGSLARGNPRGMKRTLVIVTLVGAAAVATGAVMLDDDARNTLTPIDSVPTKQQIDSAFDNNSQTALTSLASIATDSQGEFDIGMRLRAIHALAKYCGAPPDVPCANNDLAHQSVAAVITLTRTETMGSGVLILRAAIETLGGMKISSDVSTLIPLLEHPRRDIRAATARALRDLCNTQAITPLRARYSVESTDQVKLAISEALRILGQCM